MKDTAGDINNTRTTKRMRDDTIKTTAPSSYAAATTGGFHPDPQEDKEFQDMMQQLKDNMDNLSKIERSQQDQHTKNKELDDAIVKLTTGQANHGKVLKQLSNTQIYQGRLLTTLNTKVTKLCDLLLDPSDKGDLDLDVEMDPPGSPLSLDSSNPSHGEPGGQDK